MDKRYYCLVKYFIVLTYCVVLTVYNLVKMQKPSFALNYEARGQLRKPAKQELRLTFFLKWNVYSYSISQNLKLKSKIFHETGSRFLASLVDLNTYKDRMERFGNA